MDDRESKAWLLGHLVVAAGLAAAVLAKGLTPQERLRRDERRERQRAKAELEDAELREAYRRDEDERAAWRAQEERRRTEREALWLQPEVRTAFWSRVYNRFEPDPTDEEFVHDRPQDSGNRSAGRLTSVARGDRLESIFSDPRDMIYQFEYTRPEGTRVGVLLDSTHRRDEREFAEFIVKSAASADELRRVAQFLSYGPALRMSSKPLVLAKAKSCFAVGDNGFVDRGERALFLDDWRRARS